jgi:hypothetical protein
MIWNKPFFRLSTIQQLWRKLWGWTPLYWLRCHTFTKYHIVDIRGQDGYKWGWIDRSHAMYLACFTLLVDFVEKEDPTIGLRTEADYRGDTSDGDWKFHKPSIDHQLANEQEVRALYDWWKTGRKAERDACDAIIDGLDLSFEKMFVKPDDSGLYTFQPCTDARWTRWTAEHDRLEAKDEEMLMRLMKVRRCLWT